MKYRELSEARPTQPLTPAQATKRADKIARAQARFADAKAQAAIKIAAARRKLTEL